MPELEKSVKHPISLPESVWRALEASAKDRRMETRELIQKVLEDFLLEKENTLPPKTRQDIIDRRWLIDRVKEAAMSLCRSGQFASSLISDAIVQCEGDPEWAARYTAYVRDDMYKHGNPRKDINRDFGWHIIRSVGGVGVKKDDKPSFKTVKGHVFQSYTELRSFDADLVN
jgi:hypothetical protein